MFIINKHNPVYEETGMYVFDGPKLSQNTPDWIHGYTSIALMAKVFMFTISFSPPIEQILWNGRLHRGPDLLV